jgi:glycosyltransferase involved in cell wall biosynthesis
MPWENRDIDLVFLNRPCRARLKHILAGRHGMSLIVSHPTGNACVRAVLRAAERSGRLHSFWTALAMPPRLADLRLIGLRARREIGRRVFPETSWGRTRVRPWRESVRLLATHLRWQGLTRHESGWASVDQVYRQLDQEVANSLVRRVTDDVRAVYAYEDGALATFRAARVRGVTCLYDLPTVYWGTLRRLLEEEAELNPAWVPTMQGLRDSPPKLARKDEEIELADRVVVASSFTKRTLEQHFGARLAITVTPYGAPPPLVEKPARRNANEPLRLLYAGHLTQPKGMAYLIAALRRVDVPWSLTLAGRRPVVSVSELDTFLADPRCRWLGHVPHATLLEEMSRAHLFVFPSLVEGFGMVLLEAMAAGLPVITTDHTAGPEIMTNGREGFIVPIRSAKAIAEHIAALANDEDRRYEMAEAALSRATISSWRSYEESISVLLDQVVQ